MAYVADGGKCVGFVLRRGRTRYEAFDADEKSLGPVSLGVRKPLRWFWGS
jgi:hypothetical protein